MSRLLLGGLAVLMAFLLSDHSNGGNPTRRASLLPTLSATIAQRLTEFDRIPPERRAELEALAGAIAAAQANGQTARINFICTHNSRRSHMAQLWAAAAAAHFSIDRIRTYSGGTETTAFNPRAVAAMRRAGFDITPIDDDDNPIYIVRLAENAPALACFSKVHDHAPNPRAGFIAVMVCDDADEACPYVPGAAARLAIRYIDPKAHDNTSREAHAYDERSAQIAREMLYAMSLLTTP